MEKIELPFKVKPLWYYSLALLLYLLTSFTTWTFLPIDFWLRTLLVCVLTITVSWFLIPITWKVKIFALPIITLIGFIIFFVYVEAAHEYAMGLCFDEINKLRDNQQSASKGYFKSYYQHLDCEKKMLPFPWGKRALISDNPEGFIPIYPD